MNHKNPLDLPARDFAIFSLLNSLGALPAASVAARLSINRTTVFSALRRLIEKGFVFEIPSTHATLFSAVDPDQILEKSRREMAERERKFSALEVFTRQLSVQRGGGTLRPNFSYFEGENGVIALFEKSLTLGKNQKSFLTLEKIPCKILQYLMSDYIDQKKRNRVQSKVLLPFSKRAVKYATLDCFGNRETRFVPKDSGFETEIVIGEQSVVIFDFRGPVGVLVESPAVANTLHTVFDLLWASAKKS